MRRAEEDDPHSRVFYQLCSMIVQIRRCPSPAMLPFPPVYSPGNPSSSSPMRRSTTSYFSSQALLQSSPASFGLLFLGVSLALMMFGSVIFLIGFILMPWVVGLVLIFYFAGILFNLSHLGRSLLCWAMHPQDVHAWKYSQG